jgi:hypothetical protein
MTVQTPPPGAPLMGASSQEVGLPGIDARQEGLIRHTFIDFKQTSDFLNRPLVFERATDSTMAGQDGRSTSTPSAGSSWPCSVIATRG